MVLVGILGNVFAQNNSTMTRADSIRITLKNPQSKEIILIAKRGDWHGTTANSLAAIEKAIKKGAHIVMVDLKKNEEGDIVLDTNEGKHSTLKEALQFCKGRILLEISNPNRYYYRIKSIVEECNAANGIILNNLNDKDGEMMHTAIIDLDKKNALALLSIALKKNPVAVEFNYKQDDNPNINKAIKMAWGKSRILFNTSQTGLAGSHCDPASARDDRASIWGSLISMGGTVICTNQLKPLVLYLHPEMKSILFLSKEKQSSSFTRNNGYGNRGGIDKSADTLLAKIITEVIPLFKKFTYNDTIVGRTMQYNLFLPKDYDGAKRYPLVLFMSDASTVGEGSDYTLTQGYGGIIWATEESQKKNPCIVLVPYFSGPDAVVNDNWQISEEVAIIPHLVEYVSSQYCVDRNRIYTTGQSMGGMISFYLNVNNPSLFAASMFVSSQWDTNVLKPLANKHFFYIVSDADSKASPKMTELGEMLKREGADYGETTFSARLPLSQQNDSVRKLIAEGKNINFVRFTPRTVMPEGKESNMAEHMYAFDRAYLLDAAREWLFTNCK